MTAPETAVGTDGRSERSTGELVGDLARQMTALVHHELELAKVEMTEKSKRAGKGAGLFGASGVLALLGAACLTACVIAALDLVMPLWLAALIVGVAYLLVAGVVLLVGRSELREATPPVPLDAVESSKEDVRWLKTQAASARR